ncbi:MAG: M15 family metallopeptidase [Bacilli bacterium]|nr:M15 family metallopeptidase [Bacilli bacterium]
MKKKIILIVILVVFICIISGSIVLINSKRMSYKIDKNIEVNIFDKVYNTDYIKNIKNGKIITKKKLIDTSKLGTTNVTISIKNYFKKTKKVTYKVKVVDKEEPTITFNDKLSVEEGNEIDLLKDVKAEDNSREEIKVEVVGDYDLKTPNTYELEYVAKDSSGNEKREKFILEVTKKKEVVVPSSSSSSTNKTFTTSNGHSGKIVNGITYIDGYLIANKTYALPSSYNPGGLNGEMYSALQTMINDAASQGISLWIKSGYRSYSTQQGTYAHWVNTYGQATADTISARPGHSEHQTGLAVDLNSLDQDFEYTPEGKWLNNNCYKYGFIIRFVKGKENETGYAFEPWHVRYVGTDLATKLYNGGNWITMEAYFGITSRYN